MYFSNLYFHSHGCLTIIFIWKCIMYSIYQQVKCAALHWPPPPTGEMMKRRGPAVTQLFSEQRTLWKITNLNKWVPSFPAILTLLSSSSLGLGQAKSGKGQERFRKVRVESGTYFPLSTHHHNHHYYSSMVRGGHFLEGFPWGRLTGRNVNTVVESGATAAAFWLLKQFSLRKVKHLQLNWQEKIKKKKIILNIKDTLIYSRKQTISHKTNWT